MLGRQAVSSRTDCRSGDIQSASAASALRSRSAVTPLRSFRSPAAAIIAALSVESARLGRNVGISRRSPCRVSSARRRLLADTPPAMPMLRAWCRRAASNVRSISVLTTTRWKLAQISAISLSAKSGSAPSPADLAVASRIPKRLPTPFSGRAAGRRSSAR